MKISLFRVVVLAVFLGFVLGSPASGAEDLGAVKVRIQQRLSQLDQLKEKGVVGENNRGFVELRGGGVDAGDAVAAENRDRTIVYAAIAQKVGASADQVGRRRARHIAAASAKGVWLQKDDGSWYRK